MLALSEVHFSAVLAATIASMVIGCVWYSEGVFGGTWMKLVKLDTKKAHSMGEALVFEFLFTFLRVFVLALFFMGLSITELHPAWVLSVFLWAGMSVPLLMREKIWAQQDIRIVAINLSHDLMGLLVAAAVLVKWPL